MSKVYSNRKSISVKSWKVIKTILIILIAMSLIEVVSFDFAYVIAADILFYIECLASLWLGAFMLRKFPHPTTALMLWWNRVMPGVDQVIASNENHEIDIQIENTEINKQQGDLPLVMKKQDVRE